MLILVSQAKALNAVERKCCRSISFRKNGLMSETLTAQARKDTTWVARAFADGMLVGWALCFKPDRLKAKKNYEFHVYVRYAYRRQHIGYKLFKAITDEIDIDNVIYWTDTPGSTEFYNHCFALYKVNKEVAP